MIQTRRHVFAPPLGSATAESQPTEQLLLMLEEADNRSLGQHLAYLDLCIVAESNVDTWRRTAFFEETGETYKRVIGACLRPLDNLTLRLVKGLEIFESDKSGDFLKQQMQAPGINKSSQGGSIKEIFRDFQVPTLPGLMSFQVGCNCESLTRPTLNPCLLHNKIRVWLLKRAELEDTKRFQDHWD